MATCNYAYIVVIPNHFQTRCFFFLFTSNIYNQQVERNSLVSSIIYLELNPSVTKEKSVLLFKMEEDDSRPYFRIVLRIHM